MVNNCELRDTWSLIKDLVSVAGSLDEVKRLVAEEIKKGDCESLSERIINERIELLWAGKINALESIKNP